MGTARRDEVPAGAAEAVSQAARGVEPAGEGGLAPDADVGDVLLRRLDRIVVLASHRDGPAAHGELLDELRGLVRAAEQLRTAATETAEEVVERPARRLRGT